MSKRFVTFLFGLVSLAGIGSVWAQGKAHLTIESWRNDDLKIWAGYHLARLHKEAS